MTHLSHSIQEWTSQTSCQKESGQIQSLTAQLQARISKIKNARLNIHKKINLVCEGLTKELAFTMAQNEQLVLEVKQMKSSLQDGKYDFQRIKNHFAALYNSVRSQNYNLVFSKRQTTQSNPDQLHPSASFQSNFLHYQNQFNKNCSINNNKSLTSTLVNTPKKSFAQITKMVSSKNISVESSALHTRDNQQQECNTYETKLKREQKAIRNQHYKVGSKDQKYKRDQIYYIKR